MLTAAVLTIGCSAVVAVVLLGLVVEVLLDRAGFEAELADQLAGQAMYEDLDTGALTVVLVVVMALLVAWAVAAIVLALWTLRGSDGARITLVVSAIVAAVTSLLGLLLVVPLLVGAACVWTVVLLLRGEVSRWFAASRRRDRGLPPDPGRRP